MSIALRKERDEKSEPAWWVGRPRVCQRVCERAQKRRGGCRVGLISCSAGRHRHHQIASAVRIWTVRSLRTFLCEWGGEAEAGTLLIDAEGERDWDSIRRGGLGDGVIREAAEVGDSESETEWGRQVAGAVMPAGGGRGVVFFGFCGMEFCGWLPWIAIEWWA